jgi:hypothetical protein
MSVFGSAHPDVALIRIDLARAGAMDNSGLSDEQLVSLVRSAAPVLKRAFPPLHPAVVLVSDLESAMNRVDLARFPAVRRRLIAVPSNVIFL